MLLSAQEIDYNEDTGEAEARGAVQFQHFARGEELWADRVAYNLRAETGKFYVVRGSAYSKIDAKPGVLGTSNPFYFQGNWAERLETKYILYDGFVTDCRVPNPWWRLTGPKFDIIPGERALAYRSVFRVRSLPLFYAPFFYKSLEKEPRRSGFLLPNFVTSSRRGPMIGLGYYWAINRSYDVTYRFQDFTQRGFGHHIEFRGKPRAGSDFDAIIYGVNDRGQELENGDRLKQGGFSLNLNGKSDLGHGFYARGSVNYLSSFVFRQAFTESFNEAIYSEVHSVGFVAKQWSSYSLNLVFARLENFQSAEPGDSIVLRKLPELQFQSRDRQVWKRGLPLWISMESSAGLLRRTQPLFQTRQFLERLDFQPRIRTAIHWKDFHLIPSFSVRETYWGSSQQGGEIIGKNLTRSSREFTLDLIAPSFERTFDRKTWLGDKIKHVIEPRASFRYVTGVEDFDRPIRFDETELLSNTSEAEISITNRFYAKRNGQASEFLSWQLWQRRYFDPDFGGAVLEGRRNVVLSSAELTPYAFLDRPRSYSPVVSALRAMPRPGVGLEWRADYDPAGGRIVNSGFNADVRLSQFLISAGHNHVSSNPAVLTPSANQFRGLLGYGSTTRPGWSAAFTAVYDYRLGIMQFATTQVTYNTDCCGLSVQYRRFSFGSRNENQFRVQFAVANIGAFGTLKKQERLF